MSKYDLQYAALQEANRQADFQARAAANLALQQQRYESELELTKQKAIADAANKSNNWDLHRSQTNAAFNKMVFEANQKALPKLVKVRETDKDTGRVTERMVPESQFQAENRARIISQNAPKMEKLMAEKDLMEKEISAGDKRYGFFNLRSRPNRVTDLNAEIAALTPPDLLAPSAAFTPPTVASPTVASAEPAAPVDSRNPVRFNGITSMSGPGYLPVRGSAFIGTPGGQNRFVDTSGQVDAPATPKRWEAPSDLMGSKGGFTPSMGDLKMAESNMDEARTPQDAPMADFTPGPLDDSPSSMGSPSSVYKSAEQVRNSFRSKKIDRETARILLEQFPMK